MTVTDWLLESDKLWTRYCALVDLLDRPEEDAEVQTARAEMLAHSQAQTLIAEAAAWPGYPLKRRNDAAHPIYKFSMLADFGVWAVEHLIGLVDDNGWRCVVTPDPGKKFKGPGQCGME